MHPDVMQQKRVFKGVTLPDLDALATKLIELLGQVRVCVLKGELGAGKTTLVKAMCRMLKVKDVMSSPTFSIINEYRNTSGDVFFHFDFYRIETEAEAFDIGTEEYFYSGNYCFVEWAEKIPSLLPETYAQINILVEDETHRTIEFLIHG